MADEHTVENTAIGDAIKKAWEAEEERVQGLEEQAEQREQELSTQEENREDDLADTEAKEPELELDAEPKEEEPAPEPSDGEKPDTETTEEPETKDEGREQYRSPITAPTGWTRSQKRAFYKLPENLQSAIAHSMERTEQDLQAQLEEVRVYQERYADVDRILAPRREYMERQGISPAMLVEQMLNLSDWGDRDPMALINWFAQQKGIDLRQAFGAPSGAGPAAGSPQSPNAQSAPAPQANALDPRLVARLDQIEQRQHSFAQQAEQRQQSEQEALLNDMKDQIRAFREETDENGNLLRPYFTELYDDMIALIRGGRAKDVPSAYDMASRANPAVYHEIQNEREQRDRALRAQQQRERAMKAKRAAKSLGGGEQVSPTSPGPGDRSVRDTLEAHWSAAEDIGRV